MRTTLTLDDDVAALIKQAMKKKKKTLKEVVNQGLRCGLTSQEQTDQVKHRTPSISLGLCYLGDVDDISEVLEVAESGDFK